MNIYRSCDLEAKGRAYLEFLRTTDLSAGIYRLKAGASDAQLPHNEEEVYYVISGRARFLSGEGDLAVDAGDILFVPAKETHRFHDIEENLELLVFFGPAEGTR